MINGAVLWAVSAIVILEVVKRLGEPRPVLGGPMLGVAAAGLMANVASAVVLHGGRRRSLNLKGAYLHVLADALGSLSVLLAALIIRLTGWIPADSAAILTEARTRLFDRFGIEHVTIQIEESDNLEYFTGTCGDIEPFDPSSSCPTPETNPPMD